MKIYVLQVPPEGAHYEGGEDSGILELADENIRSLSAIQYVFDAGLSEGGLWVTGTIRAEFECRCVRCLEWFSRAVVIPDFAFQTNLEGRDMVDLTETIREDTLLALPAHPLCDWDGKRVCKAAFTEARLDIDSLDEKPDVWKALDNLKI